MPVQKPVVIVYAENASFIDREFFTSLDARIVLHQSSGDLVVHLRTTRPNALVLVATLQMYLSRPGWLRDVERRSVFEGLRVFALITSPGGMNVSFSRFLDSPAEQGGRGLLARTLNFRDVFICEPPPYSPGLRKLMLSRVALAFGTSRDFDPDEDLALTVREKRPVRLGFPGRVSWLSSDGLICVECSARVHDGSNCRVRFVNSARKTLALDLTSVKSSSSDLRFNFGSEITFKIDSAQREALDAHWAEDSERAREDGPPIHRSVVVIKTAELRERVTTVLRSLRLEVRVPLLWRNVKNDVVRMNPQVVVIESSILQGLGSKVNEFLQMIRSAADPSVKICMIGPGSTSIIAGSNDFLAFESTSDIELSLRNSLDIERWKHASNASSRFWLGPDTDFPSCLVEISDTVAAISNRGFELETLNSYRSLSQFFVEMGDGKYRVLVKNLGSWSTTDSWRVVPGSGSSVSRVFLGICHEARGFWDDFRASVEAVSTKSALGGHPGWIAPVESAKAMSSSTAGDGVARGSNGRVPDESEWAQVLEQLNAADVESAARSSVSADTFEPTYIEPLRTKKKVYKVARRDWVVLWLSLVVIGFVIATIILIGGSRSELSDSFESLFRAYKK
jgi:hypothetical protein